ncbi:MAG: PmoA family protein [Pirellulales bacterium]|nr:PmoA family protein [Pirellulales bacterium]
MQYVFCRIGLALWALVCLGGSRGVALAEESAGRLRIVEEPTKISVLRGDRPVLEYQMTPAPYKPYVRRLFSPGGTNILRDAPHDHLHHHGLMFALEADGTDFWGEKSGARPGTQHHIKVEKARVSARDDHKAAGFSQRLDWVAPGKKDSPAKERTILQEHRRIEVLPAETPSEPTMLTWRTTLKTASNEKPVVLTGPHYLGLGMRFVSSMDKNGRMIVPENGEGRTVRGDERITAAAWVAYTASADGKLVTVALFDHPSNPRHPAGLFTMTRPFAYLSATLGLDTKPLSLAPGRSLKMCYGVALWDGRVDHDAIQRQYRVWVERAGKPKVAPSAGPR